MKKRKKIQLMRDVLIFFLALILHFEEWVWNRVTPVFTFFARLRIIQRFEDSIRKLDPYASLSLFLVPAGMTLLAKIWAFEIMAKGHIVTGVSLFFGAKILGFMILSRIFTLTKAKTLKIDWFRISYFWFIGKKDWIYARLEQMGIWRALGRIRSFLHEKKRQTLILARDLRLKWRRFVFGKRR